MTEQAGIATRERTRSDQVHDATQFRILRMDCSRVVPFCSELHDLLGGQPEQEKIINSNFLAYFDVGAVQRADGQGSIQ